MRKQACSQVMPFLPIEPPSHPINLLLCPCSLAPFIRNVPSSAKHLLTFVEANHKLQSKMTPQKAAVSCVEMAGHVFHACDSVHGLGGGWVLRNRMNSFHTAKG
jgi:hypothetical protein